MNQKLSTTAQSLIEKLTEAQKFKYDPYLNIAELLKKHREIIEFSGDGSNRWLTHMNDELMKFWLKDGAKDCSKGLYRSFLTHEGQPLPGLDESSKWPQEFQDAIVPGPDGKYATEAGDLLAGGNDRNADYNFVRSHSRQVFAYGMAYHMTGRQEYFGLCRKGAMVLAGLVGQDGSMPTRQALKDGSYVEDDKDKRTSQDLAYGMTGMAFYYYLTHDEAMLQKILALKNYIWKNYYSEALGLFTWLPLKDGKPQSTQAELVAHLDQLYAYMLWLTPSLPKEHKEEFKRDMKQIVNIIIERFYSEVYGTFWGATTSGAMEALGTDHTDFGHSVKAMWVIYQVGVWTEDVYFINFARQKIHAILEAAFDAEKGIWNRRILPDGTLDKDKEWWGLAELDQAAAILAIKDPSYLQYLNKSYPFWFNNLIDMENGEVWHVLDGATMKRKPGFPKAHCWKNSLHSSEHTLVCYLCSKQVLSHMRPWVEERDLIELYYAFESLDEVDHRTVSPYIFKGYITDKVVMDDIGAESAAPGKKLRRIKVTFDALH